MSYCTGDTGKEANQASSAHALLASPPEPDAVIQDEKVETSRLRVEQNYSKKRVGEGDITLDKGRLADALAEERKRRAEGADEEDRYSKKKRGLEIGTHDVTEEELGELTITSL